MNPEFPLGRLLVVLDPRSLQEPANEYQDINIEIVRVINNVNPECLHYVYSERNTQKKLFFQFLYTSYQCREVVVKGKVQYTYKVKNSELEDALKERRVQDWLREKEQLCRKVYMIVGLCTLQDPRVEEKTTYKRVLKAEVADPLSILSSLIGFRIPSEYTLKMIFSTKSTKEKESQAIVQAMGECVCAVLYRLVDTKSRLTKPQWVGVFQCRELTACFTEGVWNLSLLGKRECRFKEKEGPICCFDSLPYTVDRVYLAYKVRETRVSCILPCLQVRLHRHR